MSDLISRQAAIDAICEDSTWLERQGCTEITMVERKQRDVDIIENLPTVQPNHNADVSKMEIIRCKDCKHWNLQVGNVKGDGLGSCDFHNVNLVTGEGFCYWADMRGDSDDEMGG